MITCKDCAWIMLMGAEYVCRSKTWGKLDKLILGSITPNTKCCPDYFPMYKLAEKILKTNP